MENGNNGFTFFKNYYTATNNMTDEQRLQFYDAIIEYGILNKEPKLDGLMLSAFELARTCIDKSIDIRERGRRGGIAKGKNYKEDESCYIAKTEVLNSKNESAKYEEKRIEENRREVEEEEKRKEEKKERKRFAPPTVDDVRAYCTERGNGIDPQRFVDFYQSKGWKVGNNTMKDWKAAVRTWEQRDAAPKKAEDDTEIRQYYQAAKNTYPNNTKKDEGWERFRKLTKGNPGTARRLSAALEELVERYYSGEYGLISFEKDLEVAYEYIRH